MDPTADTFAANQLPKAKPKKPLFKRQAKPAPKTQPTPALPDANSPVVEKDDEDLVLFKQSKHFFPAILRDQDEEREEELRNSLNRSASEAHESKRQKRDRAEDSDGDLYNASPSSGSRKRRTSSIHSRPITPPSSRHRDHTESCPRDSSMRLDKGKGLAAPYSLTTPTKGSSPSGNAMDLDDSEDDDVVEDKRPLPTSRGGIGSMGAPANGTAPAIVLDDSDEAGRAAVVKELSESDDDIEEIPPATEPAKDQFAHFVVDAEQRRDAQIKAAATKEATAAAGGPVPIEDRVVTIIVTSRLGGSDMRPIQFKRRVSGNIKAVRDCVGTHAPSRGRSLTEAERESLFVTWKGRRLFNQNTIMSLGVIPDEDGFLRRTTPDPAGVRRLHDEESDGYTEGGALHFEVWTEEGYEAWSRQQKKKYRRELGEDVSDDEDEAAEPEQHAKNNRIRIIMKSQHHEPVKTSVAPTDTVADLMLAFRTCRKIGPDKEVEIHFDGVSLEGQTTIDGAGIEDKDAVDVHVKPRK